MLDIKFVRETAESVKENNRKKFQHHKLTLVDEALELDKLVRGYKGEVESLRARRNKASQEIGDFMRNKEIEKANAAKAEVTQINTRIAEIDVLLADAEAKLKKNMMIIPNIIDPSVPIGKDDSENVEVKRYLEPALKPFDVPYHLDILERVGGIDLDSARKVAGNGFYYLMGNIARLHEGVIAYARDFMIEKGFTYCIPPFMIRSNVVTGVMSFDEMEAMMYKIEGEDL